MEVLAKTRKLGGSIIVTLPKVLVEREGLAENQIVRVAVRRERRSGFGLFKGVGPFTKEDEFTGQLE